MTSEPAAAADSAELRALAMAAKAWPFEEARKVLARVESGPLAKAHVLFETGYGPSGLPHIGTFAEVVRTTMVRQAFARLSGLPTRLVAFSDDMDGLRKVPDNVPNQAMMQGYVGDKLTTFGTPLTAIPDPFGTHESFGHHNNARLRAFLDAFGFDYEFRSSTECYRSGEFDPTLRAVLERYDEIMAIVLPTFREERRRTYCPFLPIRERGGRPQVLEVPAVEIRPQDGTIVFEDEVEGLFEMPVTGGQCKLQWRVDWAMRWVAFGVDYEMSGKDLIDSVRLGGQIARVLGGAPPEGFTYELFLDEAGEKISKSKGNGLTVEEWLRYGTEESLSLYMYQSPRRAKRLYFDVIPKHVDDYLAFLAGFPAQAAAERLESPIWHIHDGHPPEEQVPLGFSVLLNLASVCNTEDKAVLWGFISRYAPGAAAASHPLLDRLVGYALAYFRDLVKPAKVYRAPGEIERRALEDLAGELRTIPAGSAAEDIQSRVYEVGKRHPFESLRDWFKALYEVLFGQSQGPRMGSFIALYGVAETVRLIERALAGEDLAAPDDGGP